MTSQKDAAVKAVPGVADEAEFLLDRLDELDLESQTIFSDWNGHVYPAIARLRAALSAALPLASVEQPGPVGETLRSQIERLGQFITEEVPGEPSQSEGATDCAIRWMREALAHPGAGQPAAVAFVKTKTIEKLLSGSANGLEGIHSLLALYPHGEYTQPLYAHPGAGTVFPLYSGPVEAARETPEHGYATRLLVSLMEKHYPDRHPEWAPLPDLMGVLAQLDNMSTGLVRAPLPEQEPRPEIHKEDR